MRSSYPRQFAQTVQKMRRIYTYRNGGFFKILGDGQGAVQKSMGETMTKAKFFVSR